MNKYEGLYNIRDATTEDVNFIMASFLKGLYYGNSWFTEIPQDLFMTNYKKVAELLVQQGKATVKVACLPDEPNIILGYSILSHDMTTVVWVYVKKQWRKKGIGRSLTPIDALQVMHLTPIGKSLLHKFNIKPIFNPFFNP